MQLLSPPLLKDAVMSAGFEYYYDKMHYKCISLYSSKGIDVLERIFR